MKRQAPFTFLYPQIIVLASVFVGYFTISDFTQTRERKHRSTGLHCVRSRPFSHFRSFGCRTGARQKMRSGRKEGEGERRGTKAFLSRIFKNKVIRLRVTSNF